MELQRERLKEQHRQKSRQLGAAVRRLQELADASEGRLGDDSGLLRALLKALRERAEREEQQEVEEQEQGVEVEEQEQEVVVVEEEEEETGSVEKSGAHDQ